MEIINILEVSMFDRNNINWNIQYYGICVPFSYYKAVTAVCGIKDDYTPLLIEYILTADNQLNNILNTATDKLIIQKLVEYTGILLKIHFINNGKPDFDINYSFVHDFVFKHLHKNQLVVVTKVPRPDFVDLTANPDNYDLSVRSDMLMNLSFKYLKATSPKIIEEWHSVIVGFDSLGLYIVDPNHDTPYQFDELYLKYTDVVLGECLSISK